MPDTQQEIANSSAAVSAADGDRRGGAVAGAGRRQSFVPLRAERRRVPRSTAGPGGRRTRITYASRTSDDALALKRVYFSARVIPIVMSWPLCPAILSVPSVPPFPSRPLFFFSRSLSFSSFRISNLDTSRNLPPAVDKALVHIGAATREDTMWTIEERAASYFFLFLLTLRSLCVAHTRSTRGHSLSFLAYLERYPEKLHDDK